MTDQNNISPIDRCSKEKLLHQKAKVIWFTGLPCSGKTTLALHFEKALFNNQKATLVIDGDIVRNGLNKDLNFSVNSRSENIRRIAEVSKLLLNNGIIVIVSLVSPLTELREMAKEIIGASDFIEIYVNAPIEVCEKRDVKGMYKKARLGEIKDFTGIQSAYEKPQHPFLEILTADDSIDDSLEILVQKILPILQ